MDKDVSLKQKFQSHETGLGKSLVTNTPHNNKPELEEPIEKAIMHPLAEDCSNQLNIDSLQNENSAKLMADEEQMQSAVAMSGLQNIFVEMPHIAQVVFCEDGDSLLARQSVQDKEILSSEVKIISLDNSYRTPNLVLQSLSIECDQYAQQNPEPELQSIAIQVSQTENNQPDGQSHGNLKYSKLDNNVYILN